MGDAELRSRLTRRQRVAVFASRLRERALWAVGSVVFLVGGLVGLFVGGVVDAALSLDDPHANYAGVFGLAGGVVALLAGRTARRRGRALDVEPTVADRLKAIGKPSPGLPVDGDWQTRVPRRYLLLQYFSLAVFVPAGPALVAVGIAADRENLVAVGGLTMFVSAFGVWVLTRFASTLRLKDGTLTLRGPRVRTTLSTSDIAKLELDGPSPRRIYVSITMSSQRFYRFGPIPADGVETIAALRAAAPGAAWELNLPTVDR